MMALQKAHPDNHDSFRQPDCPPVPCPFHGEIVIEVELPAFQGAGMRSGPIILFVTSSPVEHKLSAQKKFT